MLAVRGRPNADLAASQRQRATYDVEWVDIDEPWREFPYTPGETAQTSNNDAITHVARQGWAQGAAYFSRLEGQVARDGVVYFTSTQGGGPAETGTENPAGFGRGSGQVWAYRPASGKLRCVFQSSGPMELDLPDNITTSKRGTLVVCEDNVNDNYVRGLSKNGKLWDIALNRLRSASGADRSNDEFAGSTFSPGGETLFVNIQASRGMSFAIWGPWHKIGV
jgi:secreted PhoX family phosphatase